MQSQSVTYIIQRCIRKDNRFQKVLYETYRGMALKVVFRYIFRYEKAVDVVTDGFVKLFNSFDQFNISVIEEENKKLLIGYLKKIMINAAIDSLRKEKMMPEIGGIDESALAVSENDQNLEQLLEYKELIAMVKELPPRYRLAFNMYIIDGYNHSEIAQMLDIPIGTSKSNLARARLMLQNNIKKLEEERNNGAYRSKYGRSI